MKVTFVTKNRYKAERMKEVMEQHGIDLEIISMETPEIQADSTDEVAKFSAKWAAEKLNKPVLKADSGLFVEALNGLPGVYTSQFRKRLGVKKFIKLMEGETNRKAKIVYSLAYCEPGKEPIVFTSECEGTIANEPRGEEGLFIDFIFTPKGETRTLGKIRKTDPTQLIKYWGDTEEKFIEYIQKQNR